MNSIPGTSGDSPVNSISGRGTENRKGLKPTWIPRLVPVGGIIVLLALLIPMLREKQQPGGAGPGIEAPLAMKAYSTGDGGVDSLLAEGLRAFNGKDYSEAARLLTQGHFYWTVKMREGEVASYPADLRFYVGLAELYRGRPERAAPYLEEEARENDFDEKYPWYLAHAYAAQRADDKARAELEKVVALGGPLAAEAAKKLKRLPIGTTP